MFTIVFAEQESSAVSLDPIELLLQFCIVIAVFFICMRMFFRPLLSVLAERESQTTFLVRDAQIKITKAEEEEGNYKKQLEQIQSEAHLELQQKKEQIIQTGDQSYQEEAAKILKEVEEKKKEVAHEVNSQREEVLAQTKPLASSLMDKLTVFLLCSLLLSEFSASAWAAGPAAGAEEGHATVMDLISPFINFFIFIGILYWFTKDRIKNHFSKNRAGIVKTYEEAKIKMQQAEKQIQELEEKVKNLPQKKVEILQQTGVRAEKFESEYKEEIKDKIARLKEDSKATLQAQKANLLARLRESLVESIFNHARTAFSQDSSLKEVAAKKLTGEISREG